MMFPDERNLAVVVHNAVLKGTLTRRVYDLTVTMTYEPPPPTMPAVQPVPGNGATPAAK